MDKIISNATKKLEWWVERNGYAGFDPYDIKGTPLFIWFQRLPSEPALPFIAIRKVACGLEYRYPLIARKLFGVKKEINAKAMGLFAAAYINFYKTSGEYGDKPLYYLEKAQECLNWLEQNHTKGYKGICWGYPFDWQSLHFLPRGTPSSVVSSTAGNAFFEFYKATGNERYLDVCNRICEFFLAHLKIDRVSEDKICFSYTPLDCMHVHNANLFVAEYLIRVGSEIQNWEYVEYGTKALQYTLAQQNEDGSFYYFGLEDETRYNLSAETLRRIDPYHTGFVLRSLLSITENTSAQHTFEALIKGYEYYINNLFEEEAIPKMSPQELYPIDIHSCAEAILCLSILSRKFPKSVELARKVAWWTIQNMQSKTGYFYYRIYSTGKLIKIPYIRWGQAWMLLALSAHQNEIGAVFKLASTSSL